MISTVTGWARYPALWTLNRVDPLPNPYLSDVEALDQNPIAAKDIVADEDAEANRPEFNRQAREWALEPSQRRRSRSPLRRKASRWQW